MPPHRERGSVLLADLVIASAVILVVASATAAVGAVAATAGANREAARVAAVSTARTGDAAGAGSSAGRIAPGADSVVIESSGGSVRAVVSSRVPLPHPVARDLRLTVTEVVVVPIAPFRSNRG